MGQPLQPEGVQISFRIRAKVLLQGRSQKCGRFFLCDGMPSVCGGNLQGGAAEDSILKFSMGCIIMFAGKSV